MVFPYPPKYSEAAEPINLPVVTIAYDQLFTEQPTQAVTIEVVPSEYDKQQEAARLKAKQEAAQKPKPTSANIAQVVPSDHEALMAAAGISPADYGHVEFIIRREGNWKPCVRNGGTIDCSYPIPVADGGQGGRKSYGICQALPGSKMASAGPDWATSALTQLKWCNGYAIGRYGSWAAAEAFWRANHWW